MIDETVARVFEPLPELTPECQRPGWANEKEWAVAQRVARLEEQVAQLDSRERRCRAVVDELIQSCRNRHEEVGRLRDDFEARDEQFVQVAGGQAVLQEVVGNHSAWIRDVESGAHRVLRILDGEEEG